MSSKTFYSLIPRFMLGSCLLFGAVVVGGMEDDDWYGPRSVGAAAADSWNADMQEKYGDKDNYLVLPGLVADRERFQVKVLVEATGLPPGDTPEFILVDAASSHGYEAIFWSMAKPSDIDKALQSIDLESGGSINPAALRFWAQGDPVEISVELPGGSIAIENTIFDKKTGQALEEEGFVFTGSLPVTLPDTGDKVHYAADVYDPRSIVPLYNEPTSVLDIPRQAHQGEVYGRYAVNPDYAFEHGEMLTIIMRPAFTDGRPAQLRYRLSISQTNATNALHFSLWDESEERIVKASDALTPVLEAITEGASERRAPTVTLDFDADIPLSGLSRLSRLLAVMESFNQVRVAEPLEGQFFYRAFVPSPQWREPAGRPTQPWELHIGLDEDGTHAELVLHEKNGDAASADGFVRHAHTVEEPADVARIIYRDAVQRDLDDRMPLPAVVLVFADEAIVYGTLREYLEPVLATHGTVYIFVEEKEEA